MPHTQTEDRRSRPDGAGRRPVRFWREITEGLELQEIWVQFKTDARVSYRLYSQEFDRESLEKSRRWRRPFLLLRLLFWSMLGKLSPARRLILLAALLLVFLAVADIRILGFPKEVEFLLASAALVVLLALELAERVTMKRDLEIARGIQTWLLPEAPPQVPGVDLAFATRPANTVGGDYYDAFRRGSQEAQDDPLLFVVADVAGKSVPAALLMARFQASLRTLAAAPTPLADLVAALNDQVCTYSLDGRRFTTAFIAELVPSTRSLTYVCAGHNAPVLRRSSGGTERLERGGLPLGVDSAERYGVGSTNLSPGDLLVVFTDGVSDAVDESGQEFGEPRLLDLLGTIHDERAAESLRRLMARLDAFVGSAPQFDDITCLVMRAV